MKDDSNKLPVGENSKLFISEISSAIWLIRAPLFTAIIAGLTLTVVDQIQEILFLFSEETFKESFQIVFASGLFLIFCFLLWKISHDLLYVGGYKSAYISKRASVLRRFLPVAVALIPVLSLYAGLNKTYSALAIIPSESVDGQGEGPKGPVTSAAQIAQASRREFTPRELGAFRPQHALIRAELNKHLGDLSKPGPTLRLAALGTLAFAFLLLVAGCIHAFRAPQNLPFDDSDEAVVPRYLRWKWLWFISFGVLVALFALQGQRLPGAWEMTAIPRWLGTSSVILLFLIFLAIFLGLLTRLYDKLEIPAISAFLIIALVASYLDWNNNHAVQLMDRGTRARNPPPLSASFASWVKAIPGRDNPDGYFQKYIREKNQDYPVFLFAMQGGGQYSSTLASLTLAKLFDRCPALRHHVFALSGVSGGSVGAGMFVAQLKTELADSGSPLNSDRCDFDLSAPDVNAAQTAAVGPLEAKISNLERNDFLAPLAASGLFGDFLQRFLPGPPIPTFDRARAFEAGLESAWRNANPGKKSPLEADFLDHWSPSGNVPMLLLNTTRVQTGEPILIAPFQTRRPIPNAAELRTIYPDAVKAPHSIRLSTAMSLSARFPIVAPIGRIYNDKSNAYFDLVDGGYFENSGAETLRVVHEELAFLRNYPELLDPSGELKPTLQRLRFKAIVLNEVDSDDNKYNGQTLNELSSPVNALYRARTQRGDMAINRLFSSLDLGVIRISHDPFPLPLGWRLSLSKQELISTMVGTPNECNDTNPRDIVKASGSVAAQYQDELKKYTTLDDEARKRIGTRIGNLFYLMHRNRCVLRDIIRDVRVAG